uniref:DNA-directed RNA polymerase n=1 Tax=Siphoviridae sp. ctLfk13 TaxID=2826251 RepID=A0A8S5N189_9CAUD|nr:MAG TPA: DNA-directed RNA polymerase [Siphoviridae sp. ctLfk13]
MTGCAGMRFCPLCIPTRVLLHMMSLIRWWVGYLVCYRDPLHTQLVLHTGLLLC